MIRRLEEADVRELCSFLSKLSQEDPDSGMVGAPSEDLLASQIGMGLKSWVAFEGKKLLAVLGPEMRGVREVGGEVRTFSLYNRLAVDHALYSLSPLDTLAIARDLTLAAADDTQAAGNPPDDIYVIGPTNSRGASWCRLLGMKETAKGKTSEFWLEFKLIWERCKATEAL